MAIDLTQLHQVYFEESFEGLTAMETALLDLQGGAADPELINMIFRAVHSIKGGSGTCCLHEVTAFTHLIETLLDELRAGRHRVTAEVVTLLLQSVDCVRAMLTAVRDGNAIERPWVEQLQQQCTRLLQAAQPIVPGAWAKDACTLEITPLAAVSPAASDASREPRPVDAPVSRRGSSEAPSDLKRAMPSWDERRSGVDRRSGAERRSPLGTNDTNSIRVGIDKIDALINMVGELVITQGMLCQLGEHFDMSQLDKLQHGLDQLARNTRGLQESIRRIRMVPVSFMFNRFPRLVHDLSQKLGKRVELTMSGAQTELDKTVIEKIGDPLMHLVRNALDHGIEPPAVRQAAGKPATGLLHLQACHQGSNIIIEISDDGAGLHTASLLQKARERGLFGAAESPSAAQIYDVIFQPGFSTAETVSDVSGRGVGMDVVRRNIDELGGRIEVRSQEGQGTTFTIRLPLTLAILDGQLVRVGQAIYVIPLRPIIETLAIEPSLVVAGGIPLYSLRQDYVPMIHLGDMVGMSQDNTDISQGLLVVVESAGQRVGLVVDKLHGQQQVVMKGLESNLKRVEGLAGVTILDDGTMALILDMADLLALAHRSPRQAERHQYDAGTRAVTAGDSVDNTGRYL